MLDARRVWTEPLTGSFFTLAPNERQQVINRYFVNDLVGILSGQVWVGYDRGCLLEGNLQVWLHNALLGGVYFHKHDKYQTLGQDYHPLRELATMGGVIAQPFMEIAVTRDVKNIGTSRCNAWDYEVLLSFTDEVGQFDQVQGMCC